MPQYLLPLDLIKPDLKTTPTDRRNAALTACEYATNVDDARQMLAYLGLDSSANIELGEGKGEDVRSVRASA